MDDLVMWIQRLFEDCTFGAPFGVSWYLDRAEPPITATVTPADRDTARIVLARDDVLGRLSFIARLQTFLDLEFDRPVPTCPHHRAGLVAVRAGDAVHWRCEAGDFECQVGDYQEALWPAGSDDDPHNITPMLARRLARRRVGGMGSFSVQRRDGKLVAAIKVRPGADVAAIRAAADPIAIETEEVGAIRTVRVQRAATATEPAHRALTRGEGAPMMLAALSGMLRPAPDGEACDFMVGETWVRLAPEHRLGPPGGPVVLDNSGEPFAHEGDSVCCVGGFAPEGPVRGGPSVFYAGELRVYDRPATLRTS
jgi:hypothetical protein